MRKVLVVLVLLLLYGFTPAFAQGPYVGAAFVYNYPTGSDIKFLDPGLGGNIRLGYDFGPIALEGNLMRSSHNDTDPVYGDADLTGFSLDMRVWFSAENTPNRLYLMAGIGAYSLEEFDPFIGRDTTLRGSGWDLGAGVEHYFTRAVSLDANATYRFIRYDEFEVEGVRYRVRPNEDGNILSLQLGVNYHF